MAEQGIHKKLIDLITLLLAGVSQSGAINARSFLKID
jgi:hypothetical protein